VESAFIALLFVAAAGTNVPLGIWRSGLRRFSLLWFIAIHASIPLLIALRFALSLPYWVIPPEIGLAVVGQFAGGRLAAPGRPEAGSSVPAAGCAQLDGP
jgi:hypothetical protein